MDKIEGHATLGVWEFGVDTCDLCDEVAVECAMATEPDVRLMRLCDQHVEAVEGMYGAPFRPRGEICQVVTEDDIPCGATATHVQLITFHQDGEPKIAFWPLCRKHHEARLTNGPEGI